MKFLKPTIIDKTTMYYFIVFIFSEYIQRKLLNIENHKNVCHNDLL